MRCACRLIAKPLQRTRSLRPSGSDSVPYDRPVDGFQAARLSAERLIRYGSAVMLGIPRWINGLPCLILLSFPLFCPGLAAARADSAKLVVVLYPHNSDGSPGNALVDQGIRSTFASGSSDRIEVYNEYLDTARAPDAAQQRLQVDYLRRKYAGRRVDLVIAGLSSGLDFALRYREEIFPGIPIVFYALDEREIRGRKLPHDVVGVPLKMDMPATLDLALRFHPHTERVFVIAGKASFDAFWEAEARQAFRAYEDKLEFVYLTGLPMLDLLR